MKNSKLWRGVLCLVFILMIVLPNSWVYAQEGESEAPVYLVQEGDSLWDIAVRFRVTIDDLMQVNKISDPSQLAVGARLIIPGLEGVSGELGTETVAYGETLRSLSRRYQVLEQALIQMNHLTSPTELYVGYSLVIPKEESTSKMTSRATLVPGQSLLELALINGTTPWTYVFTNNLTGAWNAIPGDVMHSPNEDSLERDAPSAMPEAISEVILDTGQFVQGKAVSIKVFGEEGLSLSGQLNDRQLHFFSDNNGGYTSLQGIHAMVEPGVYTMALSGTLPADAPYWGAPFAFSQAVLIRNGNYYFDPVLIVSPETIDPAVTKPEDAQWTNLASPITPQKLWEGIFLSPAPEPYHDCWPSLFGNRRSYNGSLYEYFHTGLDFCGGVGQDILAPAAGKVVFAGPLTVRGNATMIDHGWGVYSGYMHQSEILVNVGDQVTPGQVIGLVGGTGRVTGAHLHWEVWAGGVQVDPLDWLAQVFP